MRTIRIDSKGKLGILAISFFSTVALADTAGGGVPPSALEPVPVTILTSRPQTAEGLIFLTPTSAAAGAVEGAEIIDGQGRPVWFNQLPAGETAYDFRVQEYRHEPVITWIQSRGAFSTGPTTDYIADRHYRVIATVNAGNGLTADIHEFHLTPEGTALITAYNTVTRDLSSVGGSPAGLVTEGVVQEIDIASGEVLFEWHSLDHIGLDESHEPVPASGDVAWDYFHLNAVSLDEGGRDLLVNARHTSAAYRLDRRSGAVKWRLGGTKSDFALGPDVAFAWQHNATAVDDHGLVRFFDNEASPAVLPYSRVIWVRHDDVNRTATLERWLKHPAGLSAGSQGNAQGLENGDTFVGWGALPRFSEFDRENDLVFDAEFPAGYNTYRAYRFRWVGEPKGRPIARLARTDGGSVVHAFWNGATEVARWEVLDGESADFRVVASAPWNGLDTAIAEGEKLSSVLVVARDREGRELGRSVVTPAAP